MIHLVAVLTLLVGFSRGDDVEWRDDLAKATTEAKSDGRPLLLVFR